MNLNVAHFVSGGGTTMAHVAQLANKGALGDIRSQLVIASKADIGAIRKAQDLGILHVVVNPKNPAEILSVLMQHKIDIIFQNGWLPQTPKEVVKIFSPDFMTQVDVYMKDPEFMKLMYSLDENTRKGILSHTRERSGYNQHPGTLRGDHKDFGGKGMYGTRVTAAGVIYNLAEVRELGTHASVESSVHRLTEELDDGELIGMKPLVTTRDLDGFQERNRLFVPNKDIVLTPNLAGLISGIQKRLLEIEHQNVADVMRTLGEGRKLKRVQIYDLPLGMDLEKLDWAKRQAVQLFPKG